jgi:hypothetical protein
MNVVRCPPSGPKYAAFGLTFSIIDSMTAGMRLSRMALVPAVVSTVTLNIICMALASPTGGVHDGAVRSAQF